MLTCPKIVWQISVVLSGYQWIREIGRGRLGRFHGNNSGQKYRLSTGRRQLVFDDDMIDIIHANYHLVLCFQQPRLLCCKRCQVFEDGLVQCPHQVPSTSAMYRFNRTSGKTSRLLLACGRVKGPSEQQGDRRSLTRR